MWRTDCIYVSPTSASVSPDGVGRIFYDTVPEARAEHGDLFLLPCEDDED